tara:strand:+ start:16 stop:1395 length:1380 start_codon:yes stop_codon:yes gene_type:complete
MADKVVLEAEIKSNVGEVTDGVKDLNKATDKASKQGFGGMKKAIQGVGGALKAAGIGLVVGALASFADAFRQNQRVIDFFNIALKSTSIAFNDLFTFLDENFKTIQGYLKGLFTDPLGELYKLGQGIKRFFTDRLSSAAEVLKAMRDVMLNVFSPSGLAKAMADLALATKNMGEEMSTVFDEITSGIKEYTSGIISSAAAMVELDKAAELAIATNQKILEQKDREAEIQRQIRDDVTKSFAERIEANNQLNTILDEQEKLMLANADIVKEAARVQKELTGNDADRITFIKAEAEEAAILAQIEGFRSEQKINAISLQEEEKQVALENAEAQLAAFSGLANALSSLAGENKELAAAGAIIDTYAGANKAFAQGGVAGFVTGAAIIAAGLANLQKIYATDVGSGGGGAAGAAPQIPAPQMMSGAFELTGGTQPEPLQAYVLTDEMTNSQNQLANIRRRATI